MQDTTDLPVWVPIPRVAQHYNESVRSTWRRIERGEFSTVRTGPRQTRVHRDDILANDARLRGEVS